MTARAITRDRLTAMAPCDLDERLKLFGDRETLTVAQALKAGATVADVLWVAGQLGLREEIVAFANGCAAAARTYAARTYAAEAANAAAYAAAPDLLEALILALPYVEDASDSASPADQEIIRAAITRATGEAS